MTFNEFAEKVLGMELLDWQKNILETAQKCKDDGKSFYINTDHRAGKMLLNNIYQQKLGYDRGFEDGRKLPHTYELNGFFNFDNVVKIEKSKSYKQGAKEFAEWLLHHSMLCDSLGQDLNDYDLLTESEIIDEILAEWQREEK